MMFLKLFYEFLKVGLFAVGGGMATFPFLTDLADKTGWYTQQQLVDMIAIAESTPGPIAINCATFTGYKKAGFAGALAATFGMVVPSFTVIYLISMFLDNFLELTIIANAFKGIKIAVGILILDAAITMIKKMPKKKLPRTIMVCSCTAMLCINLFAWNFSSISLMLIAAMISLSIFMLQGDLFRKGGGKK